MIDYPQIPQGTPEEQIAQLWEYLYKLAEQLNLREEAAQK